MTAENIYLIFGEELKTDGAGLLEEGGAIAMAAYTLEDSWKSTLGQITHFSFISKGKKTLDGPPENSGTGKSMNFKEGNVLKCGCTKPENAEQDRKWKVFAMPFATNSFQAGVQ